MRDFAWRIGSGDDRHPSPLERAALALAAQVDASNVDALVARRIRVDEGAGVHYARLLDVPCKAALLNLLVRVKRRARLSIECMSVLRLPEYGGVSHATVSRMYHMTCIYYEDGPTPREYVECIDGMDPRDFVYAAYYFHAVYLLDRIRFVRLGKFTQSVLRALTRAQNRCRVGRAHRPGYAHAPLPPY